MTHDADYLVLFSEPERATNLSSAFGVRLKVFEVDRVVNDPNLNAAREPGNQAAAKLSGGGVRYGQNGIATRRASKESNCDTQRVPRQNVVHMPDYRRCQSECCCGH